MTHVQVRRMMRKKCRTVNQIAAALRIFTDEQRALAWSPEPPYESDGAHDCRPGGDCGLSGASEGKRAEWRRARIRFRREEARNA